MHLLKFEIGFLYANVYPIYLFTLLTSAYKRFLYFPSQILIRLILFSAFPFPWPTYCIYLCVPDKSILDRRMSAIPPGPFSKSFAGFFDFLCADICFMADVFG